MPTFTVHADVTRTVTVEVDADTEAEARIHGHNAIVDQENDLHHDDVEVFEVETHSPTHV